MNEQMCKRLAADFETLSPEKILAKAVDLIPNLTFACSFGAEDMVILDMLMKVKEDVNVFYLDTDVLFPETYALIDQVMNRYEIPNLTRVRPKLTLAAQAKKHGAALWAKDPTACCNIRKVEPLIRHLKQYDGWITGIRRDQAATRAHAQAFELDKKFNLVKVNPLILWTEKDVWNYIRDHNVPYNPLHDQGYPSIGCTHCTRPVRPGEDPRSGRWAGFSKTECGLHR
ncbi:phosphoadenylyl-sulfate reductase [Alicyclobacillus fodiniaquatilis]|uniref:Adenosine 5'-phosphosulfate reductase n=1 Tax=Alicyclobacillus fodiniaquatilis TaxID=1661150 RepID=A0ABW4JN87_9BACL